MVGLLCSREQRSPCRHALQKLPMSVLSQQTYPTGCVSGGKLLKDVTILLLPNLEVKGAIDTILFCPKDRSQMFCHG
jgi:hypothetical protein